MTEEDLAEKNAIIELHAADNNSLKAENEVLKESNDALNEAAMKDKVEIYDLNRQLKGLNDMKLKLDVIVYLFRRWLKASYQS